MRTTSTITAWIAALSVATLVCQICSADGTNSTTVGAISLEFQNAPISAVVEWLSRLTNRPVIIPMNVTGTFTYTSKRFLTHDEALQVIAAALETNGLYVVNVNDSYYRLVSFLEMNSSAVVPHIEIEVQGDALVVNGKPIQYNELTQTVARLVGPETEIWIHDTLASPGNGLSMKANEYLMPLYKAKPKRICVEYRPLVK